MPDKLRNLVARYPRLEALLRPAWHALHPPPPDYLHRLTAELLRACLDTDSSTILDIGANDGTHSLWFADLFKDCRVYSFEPDPRPIVRFRERLAGRDNVELFELALSSRTGEMQFFPSTGARPGEDTEVMPEGWDMSGSTRRPTGHLEAHPWVKFRDPVTVPVERLDDWAARHGVDRVDFMWMDVQGAEGDVIAGGRRVLANTRFVYTEYSERELYEGQLLLPELRKQLAGFEVLAIYRNDLLLRNLSYPLPLNPALQRMLRELRKHSGARP